MRQFQQPLGFFAPPRNVFRSFSAVLHIADYHCPRFGIPISKSQASAHTGSCIRVRKEEHGRHPIGSTHSSRFIANAFAFPPHPIPLPPWNNCEDGNSIAGGEGTIARCMEALS